MYVGGFFGQLVSGVVWLIAAAIATWVSPGAAMLALWLGGCLIFPGDNAGPSPLAAPNALPPGHPMTSMAMQIAFTVPIGLLLALAVAVDRPQWFFPACMLIVGAHYLPFAFLWIPGSSSTGGWVTGAILVVFDRRVRESVGSFSGRRPWRWSSSWCRLLAGACFLICASDLTDDSMFGTLLPLVITDGNGGSWPIRG